MTTAADPVIRPFEDPIVKDGIVWDYDSIFMPDAGVPRLDIPYVPMGMLHGDWSFLLRPEFEEVIRRETDWRPIGGREDLPVAVEQAVGCQTMPCPICKGAESVLMFHKGKDTGIVLRSGATCACVDSRRFWCIWGDDQIIPKRFRDASLRDFKPRNEKQQKNLDIVMAHPDDSMLFLGPPGTGKTHMMMATLRRAMNHWAKSPIVRRDYRRSVWYSTATKYLTMMNDWQFRDKSNEDCATPLPPVMPDWIRRATAKGLRVTLALDELDKIAPTPTKLQHLQELVNSTYECEGQLLGTANLGVKELSEKWGADLAGTVLRRFGVGDNAHVLMF